jgi:hypothetical protein
MFVLRPAQNVMIDIEVLGRGGGAEASDTLTLTVNDVTLNVTTSVLCLGLDVGKLSRSLVYKLLRETQETRCQRESLCVPVFGLMVWAQGYRTHARCRPGAMLSSSSSAYRSPLLPATQLIS